MPSVVIELVNGSIAAVYGSDPDIEVTVENGDIELTDEQESEIELEVAMHPFILYRKEDVQLCSLFWCRVILQVGLDCHSVVAFCFKSNLQFAD